MRYTVENIEETKADWGTSYVASVRKLNDVKLYVIGPAYSVQELVQKVLDRFGK